MFVLSVFSFGSTTNLMEKFKLAEKGSPVSIELEISGNRLF